MAQAPPRGIYAPLAIFFHEDESIDWDSLEKHILRLAKGGITGLVISGSNGESVHLCRSERAKVLEFTRSTLDSNGFSSLPMMAGCGTHSARETIAYCEDAAKAGAKWALVLPPSYWVGAMTKPVIKKFFTTVADKSPIPVVLYNFPAVTSGIDLDSDLVIDLAKHPSIVGMKFTCCNVGKMQRITNNVSSADSFAAIVGKSEAFLPGLVVGSGGLIGALVNLVPGLHVKLLSAYDSGDLASAQKLQAMLSDADGAVARLGVSGLKTALDHCYGYGKGRSRLPLSPVTAEAWTESEMAKIDAVVSLENGVGQDKL